MAEIDDFWSRLPRVWVFDTAEVLAEAEARRAILSEEETERHHRFSAASQTDSWLVAHIARRMIIGRLLGIEPARLGFSATGHPGGADDGKPWCTDAPQIDFNLSITRSIACLAIAASGLIGVDVEAVTESVDSERVIRRSTTDAERTTLDRLDPEERRAQFVRIWCRKEACVKAVGLGVEVGFDRFGVGGSGPKPPGALGRAMRSCSIHDLPLRWPHVGAVVCSPSREVTPPIVAVRRLDAAWSEAPALD